MNKDNPADMSNQDLEKDMQQKQMEAEGVGKSTAAEGTLKDPKQDAHSISNIEYLKDNEEKDLDELSHEQLKETTGYEEDLDDLVHRKPNEASAESVHNGSVPDPEELDHWEARDSEDKMSG